MTPIPTKRRRSRALLTTAVALAALAVPAGAGANGYDITVCTNDAPVAGPFQAVADGGFEAFANCPGSLSGAEHGLVARVPATPGGRVPAGGHSGMYLTAPAGTSLERIRFSISEGYNPDVWTTAVVAQQGTSQSLVFGHDGRAGDGQTLDYQSFNGPYVRELSGAQSVGVEVRCQSAFGCATDPPPGSPRPRAWASLANVTVTVTDPTAPVLDELGGGLWSSQWLRGVQRIDYRATDNAGVRAATVDVDGVQRTGRTYDCDQTRAIPCGNVPHDDLSIDTAGLPDGAHRFVIAAHDLAGNAAARSNTILVDNTAPGRPTELAVDGGEGWRAANGFTVRWAQPDGQAAPITRALYRLCPAGSEDGCVEGARPLAGAGVLTGVPVPAPGDWTIRVWLEDEAGNASAAAMSSAVHLRFDDTVPAGALPQQPDGWIAADRAARYEEPVALDPAGPLPPSGVAGWSITRDGSEPDATVDATGDRLVLTDLPDGVTRLRVRAVSGAGIASRASAGVELRVDRVAPDVSVENAPDPRAWQTAPVTVRLRGTDAPGASGIAGVEWALDGAPGAADGATGDVTVGSDGRHELRFASRDGAGNRSATRAIEVRVDRTAPETVAFEAPDPADPTLVRVAVGDRTSGVVDGAVEIRRAGSETWTRLATTLADGRLVARIDDAHMPEGEYDLRARARDAAGNEAVGDRRAGGERAHVALPLRLTTRVVAGIRRARAAEQLTPRTRVPFGVRSVLSGRVETTDDQPVAGATVEVHELERRIGAQPRTVATVRTDGHGRFSYRAPAGPSRTVSFHYAGAQRLAPSAGSVELTVPASVALGVDRSRLRNGQSVTFSGRLRGGRIPAAGKLVDLEVNLRGRWRAFATVRSAASGRFRHRYRFEATRGLVRYAFRARVRSEAAYPYALGYSRVVGVTVRG